MREVRKIVRPKKQVTTTFPFYSASLAPIPSTKPFALISLAGALALMSTLSSPAHAEVEAPDRRYLFSEDREEKKTRRAEKKEFSKKKRLLEKARKAKNQPFDIDAKTIQFDSTGKVISGEGGVVMSYGSAILEAERGSVNIEKKEAELSGDVRITDPTGSLSAKSASLQLEKRTAQLKDAEIQYEEGNYQISGKEIRKLEGETFEFDEAKLTTCECPDETSCPPWQLSASSVKVTREGYGQVWNGVLRAYDIPFFYTPYLIFPAKNQRQSGFLPGSIGNSKRSGLTLKVPFFWNIDRSTDATFTGILETKTRAGLDTEFRKLLSANHSLAAGATYLDESARDGLQGANTDEMSDKTLKTQRFAGYTKYNLLSQIGTLPAQLVLDGRYVNDDLLVREFENEQIAPYNSRFLTSRGIVRTYYEDFSFDGSVEYNQSLADVPDDQVLQRLPEALLTGLHTFRPFGQNPYGVKLVVSDQLSFVNFSRDSGYDGQRAQLREVIKIPLHYRNYFETQTSVGVRATTYDVSSLAPQGKEGDGLDSEIADASSRILPDFGFTVGTAIERIFDARGESLFKDLVEFGERGRSEELARLRHTLEPSIRYRYVPLVDQRENPQFDSEDRLPRKNVVTYQLTQRLFTRFEPRDEYLYGVEEAAPTIEELGNLRSTSPIDDAFDLGDSSVAPDFVELRKGSRREFASLKIAQSFNIDEAMNNRDPEAKAYSDVGTKLNLIPNEYIKFEGRSDFNTKVQDFSSFGLGTSLFNKRGDQVRARYNFIDGVKVVEGEEKDLRQLETGVEFKLSERLKAGYYARYDQTDKEFIEQRAGFRMYSACNCWIFDLDLTDRLNPNETRVTVNLTLVGLGQIGNQYFTDFFDRRRQSQIN